MTYEEFADLCMHTFYDEMGDLSEDVLQDMLRDGITRFLLPDAPGSQGSRLTEDASGLPAARGQVLTEKLCRELLSPEDFALFGKLRDLRRMISLETGLPPYTIFTNRALLDMCLKKPVTQEQFLKVYGVGPVNSGRHGAPFLELIRREQQPAETETAITAAAEACSAAS